MTLTIIRGAETTVAEARPGEKLITALERAGIAVSAPCGGRCFCGKCLVRVDGAAGEILAAERKFINDEMLKDGWRLACACTIEGDMTVYAEEQSATVMVDGVEGDVKLAPMAQAVQAECAAPSLTMQLSDAARLAGALGCGETDITDAALTMLPEALRAGEKVWATQFDGKVTGAYSRQPGMYGCAVDIGTTTMAAYLIDLTTGRQLAAASMLNPQRSRGGDVITRANYTMENPDGLSELAASVRAGVSELIDGMCVRNGIGRDEVRHITVVGNTIMMHIFAGICVKYIATLPFVPAYSATRHVPAGELGMDYPCAMVTLGPCVAGYVGADTVAAGIACGLDRPGEVALLMDIGTNGEMALRTDKGLWCCSAAAGPAFEGAHIKCGSGAVEGAIDSVKLDGDDVRVTTIGGKKAASICGSGIVSAIAEMLKAGLIDETGYLEDEFELAEGVEICQKDVREVQLAKAAIAAGVDILAEAAGIQVGDIQKLYLAGGFGSYIDKKAACEIGLIPMELLDRISGVGNAAGSGAKMLVMDAGAVARAEDLRRRMKYIELSASADFQERFADCMFFE